MCASNLHLTASQQRTVHNLSLDPGLAMPNSTGVVSCSVDLDAANACSDYVASNWKNGMLRLPVGTVIHGFNTYGKTLSKLNKQQQKLNTLIVNDAMLPAFRAHVPGFARIEAQLNEFIFTRTGRKAHVFLLHVLRQGQTTVSSTGFANHRDNEEFHEIEYTIVVKVTPDLTNEPPSAMHVVGAACDFTYGSVAGSGGFFLANSHHRSVAPISSRTHLKLSFFFRCSSRS